MTDAMHTPQGRRCGYAAVLGAPNAGKSTLVNSLVGSKVTIVSPKVQTTRTRVLGITVEDDAQIVLVDTPGIFDAQRRFDRAMVAAAWDSAGDADAVLLLVDAARKRPAPETDAIIDRLRRAAGQDRPVFLVLNKVDAVAPPALLPLAQRLNDTGLFSETFMISALSGDGLAALRAALAAAMPTGPWLFDEDQIADMPMRLLAAEITREKLFLRLHKELPYSATVETEAWDERADGSVEISQTIFVERDSQKAIVLGKGGRQIKEIGSAAREELEAMLEQRVHLALFVKVARRWQEDRERYEAWNLNFDA